ncbi:hypothetical protein SAY86_000354 [Trapa natans]|uniref:Uncharacterized protein n=1 Tax=Trapa natans TaxID=22666 RepID=A0AAN7MEW5_TRANT|nr:hypothetical protein SAY86_000354 [Trapa natans]
MGDLRGWSSEAAASGMEKMAPSPTRSESRVDNFQVAEDVTQGIITRIHPTCVSEHRRAAVINYVKWLLRFYPWCEVFSFGSVPLKTYLPDGDIDLIVFTGIYSEEVVANEVFSVLDREEWNSNAQFIVKDVQLIRAEVKLVKCIIQNIVVDISFNQLGGLCTLCFLEKVDNIIGKDHLLKRSILLIKAWCYYESRILGAHHGLLSTYGLETLILYIFHLYHSSLDGPFAVLYKFLNFYSKFDWENYCVSLKGPVLVSSLPEIVVELRGDSCEELLFSSDHLKTCMETFSVPSHGSISQRTFIRKHLNIIDPLKENNNLGRSVSRGNYFRIKSAFAFGAQKLERVVSESMDGIASILKEMFSDTMDRHESGQRPDVQDPIPFSDEDKSADEASISGRVCGDTNDLASSRNPFTSDGTSRPSTPDVVECFSPSEDKAFHAPHSYLSSSSTGLEETTGGDLGGEPADSFSHIEGRTDVKQNWNEEQSINEQQEHHSLSSSISCSSEDAYSSYPSIQASSSSLTPSNSLADLNGDYESHMINLQRARRFWECAHATQVPLQFPPTFVPELQGKSPWDAVERSVQNKHMTSQTKTNGLILARPYHPVNPQLIQVPPFRMEEIRKTRGTGMYFPNPNTIHYRSRTMTGRGRPQSPSVKPSNDNTRGSASVDAAFNDRIQRIPDAHGKPHLSSSDLNDSDSPRTKVYSNGSIYHTTFEQAPEMGSSNWQNSPPMVPSHPRSSSSNPPTPAIRRPRPSDVVSQDRIAEKSYHLKNEDDFPPLPETTGKGP